MNVRTLVRSAAVQALAAAAASEDPDFAPLDGAQVFLGKTWPSQSPAAAAGPLPSQILVYGWDETSESVTKGATNPEFATTLGLEIEARVETNNAEANATLPTAPSQSAINAAIDGAIEALVYAVKKAICQGIGVAAQALNAAQNSRNRPVIMAIEKVQSAQKLDAEGQRIAGQGALLFDLTYGEYFEPVLTNQLTDLNILTYAEAGGIADEGNAGNGTISAVTVGLGAEPGAYAVAFTSSTAFQVTMPDSSSAGTGAVGQKFTGGGLTFTIAAGAQPFAAGDGFAVTVQIATQTVLNLNS